MSRSKPTGTPDLGQLSLDDHVDEDVFASPESGATTQKHTPSSNNPSAQKQGHNKSDTDSSREARLQSELGRLQEINRIITSVTGSLEKSRQNMGTVQQTVENASTLLGTWTRILSQTEYNQRLILNPNWHGASKDLEEMEGEEVRRREETERRGIEEQRRREEGLRRAEEDETRRAAAPAASAGTRGGRSRGTRGASTSGRGYVGVGGQTGRGRGTTGPSSRGSGIGRGAASSTRGRGRGLG
ncbi:hypothetical protein LTR86_002475 [Recurvomyces mirabilis]|nr:hypothetical protein LTR86_002475 [Recurvomyces mirabilis]